MVSYMKKMWWGAPAEAASGAADEEIKEGEGNTIFTGRVTQDQIMREGWIYKRSRYL